MYQAIEEKVTSSITSSCEKLIPHGAECCHFWVEPYDPGEGRNPWHVYSEELARRALEKLKDKK